MSAVKRKPGEHLADALERLCAHDWHGSRTDAGDHEIVCMKCGTSIKAPTPRQLAEIDA